MQYGPAQGVRRAAFTIAVEAAYPLMFGRHSSRLSVRMRTLYRITAAREAGAAFGKGKHVEKDRKYNRLWLYLPTTAREKI